MILQMMTRNPGKPDRQMRGVATDPRNQQAVNILFLPICPLALGAIGGGSLYWRVGVILVIALFACGLWLVSTGIRLGKDFDAAKVARAPRFKRKIAGSTLIGFAAAVLAAMRMDAPGVEEAIESLVIGCVCAALSVVSFGPDPLRDKGLDTPEARMRDKLARKADSVKQRLDGMAARIATLRDEELEDQIAWFANAVLRMLDVVRDDPGRLRALRSHLGVYLDGAEEATARFVTLYRATADTAARADYMLLLCDLAEEFQSRATRYAQDGKVDLDVQIGVLRTKLGKSH